MTKSIRKAGNQNKNREPEERIILDSRTAMQIRQLLYTAWELDKKLRKAFPFMPVANLK